jgi:plasmid stabilization system protein ParE
VSLPVRFSAEAASEFDWAAAWYDEQGLGLGGAFIDAVETALGSLSEWPASGVLIPGVVCDLEIRRVPVARFPYQLPYVLLEDHVRVLAVAHDRRRPGYWSSRASE